MRSATEVANALGDWREAPYHAFARNLADLQWHEDRLFIGYGDATANSGPTDRLAFDPKLGLIERQGTVDEEALLRYRRVGARLWVPGIDPMGSPRDGTLHLRTGGEWTTLQVPDVAHVLDAAEFGGALFVAIQHLTAGAAVLRSPDQGATWSDLFELEGWRAVSFLEANGELYVSTLGGGMARFDGTKFSEVAMTLPAVAREGVWANAEVVARDTATCGDRAAFVAAAVLLIDGALESETIGLFVTGTPATPGAVPPVKRVPVVGTPTDVWRSAGRCYALTNETHPDLGYIARVYQEAVSGWTPQFRFDSTAYVRSGERVGDTFYFGTGCLRGQCDASAGHLLMVSADVAPPSPAN